jgi:hypothetical protein
MNHLKSTASSSQEIPNIVSNTKVYFHAKKGLDPSYPEPDKSN